ncbi:MAG: hypothetical protein ACYSX0_10630 [Planctomycetota bacterium]
MKERCRREIEELHHFFEEWFTGGIERSDAAWRRLEGVLGAEFELICPRGNRTGRESLLDTLGAAHGSRVPGTFRIQVNGYRGRSPGPGLWLATYEEWQVVEGETNGRLSTALFGERAETPNRVEWLHLHETAISSQPSAFSREDQRPPGSRARSPADS